jgi:adhesin/invasin
VTSPAGGTWLKVSAAQGQTPATVQVSVTPSGLSQGIYRGSVLFQPAETGIGPVFVPVTLVVGCNQGGCAALPAESPLILGIANSASFHISGAPGAAMTIFGRSLATSTMQALAYPLPTMLGTTMVMVNGAPAPLFYVSPGQINFQMPGNAPLGSTRVEVNVGGQQVSPFEAQSVILTAVDPGLYLNGSRAAALNPDLTPHTAATPQAAGAVLAFYLTGQGAVKPAIPDGSPAPAAPLSMLEGTTLATIGGQPAEVTFAGLSPGFVALAQINVRIPQGLSPGDHPAFIVINGGPSNAGLISVR